MVAFVYARIFVYTENIRYKTTPVIATNTYATPNLNFKNLRSTKITKIYMRVDPKQVFISCIWLCESVLCEVEANLGKWAGNRNLGIQ